MRRYTAKQIPLLVDSIRSKGDVAKKAAALTLNKAATFSLRESIDDITKEVNLKSPYIRKHLKVVKRAHPDSLEAVLSGTQRATLVERYPYSISGDKIYKRDATSRAKVSINVGTTQVIEGARMVRLRGSNEKVVGMFNKDFAEALKAGLAKTSSAKARAKYQRVRQAAIKKPYGRWPLHSRSVNQLFLSVRENIQPRLRKFLVDTFKSDLDRLST